MGSDRRDWGLLDVLDAFAAGERSPHVWAAASSLATVLRREARTTFGRQRLEQSLSSTRRDELAALLKYACYRALGRLGERGCLVTSRDAHGGQVELDDGAWASRQRALLREPDAVLDAHRAMLVAARETAWSGEASAQGLAVASLRIADEPQTSVYLANAEVLTGAPQRALVVVQGLLSRGVMGGTLTQVLLARGYACAAMGRFWESLVAYRAAAGTGHFGAMPAFYRLVLSTWLRSRD